MKWIRKNLIFIFQQQEKKMLKISLLHSRSEEEAKKNVVYILNFPSALIETPPIH